MQDKCACVYTYFLLVSCSALIVGMYNCASCSFLLFYLCPRLSLFSSFTSALVSPYSPLSPLPSSLLILLFHLCPRLSLFSSFTSALASPYSPLLPLPSPLLILLFYPHPRKGVHMDSLLLPTKNQLWRDAILPRSRVGKSSVICKAQQNYTAGF